MKNENGRDKSRSTDALYHNNTIQSKLNKFIIRGLLLLITLLSVKSKIKSGNSSSAVCFFLCACVHVR